MIRSAKISLFLFLCGCCNYCASEMELIEDPPQMEEEKMEVPQIEPNGDEKYLNGDSDYIYDQNTLHRFDIIIPQESLNFLDSDPVAEQYVAASLVFEGDTISPIGIRYKGSVGAFVGCLSGNDWANPSGFKTCTKLSLKLKINWEGREERFFGLKKLLFHSMNNDPSQMRDRLAYWYFREMGVPAPRSVHAKVYINGTYSGLYASVEQIDGRFTRYNFESGEGNLYKEVWPLTMSGLPQQSHSYLKALKTNEDDNPSTALMESFATDVSEADDNMLKSAIEKWMDIEEIISYAAVDRTIRVDDGAFHWYCGGSFCSNHNYYWYEDPEREKFHLIPWDMDNTFENIIANANPVTPIADSWGEISNNCQPFNSGIFGIAQWSASCDKLTSGWTQYDALYQEKIDAFKSGPLATPQTEANLQMWIDQIREATEQATDLHGDAVSINNWQSALAELRLGLKFARDN